MDTALDTTMAPPSATATAPAKINLTLDILGKREDGFHELRSLVIGVALGDVVRCGLHDHAGIELSCADPDLATRENLAYQAAMALARNVGREPALGIEIEKHIPVGGGLGGGSSDAATTLKLCNRLWNLGFTPKELAAIGAAIGSDVPLFFSLPAAVMTGRGGQVKQVEMLWSGWVLLVHTGVFVPTVEVYRKWDASDTARLPRGTDAAIVRASTALEIAPLLSNHLEPAVFRVAPAVKRVFDELNSAGVGPMRVTGAGSTLYRLFDKDQKKAAHQAARNIEDIFRDVTTAVVAAPVG